MPELIGLERPSRAIGHRPLSTLRLLGPVLAVMTFAAATQAWRSLMRSARPDTS